MEVVQATAWYPPHDLGGTEVYLAGLIESLRERGVHSTVVVPRHSLAAHEYEHQGAQVVTYPVGELQGFDELRGKRTHSGFEDFRAIITSIPCGIYHQHSWTRGCGPHHLAAARAGGLKTVLTVHVAGVNCIRGTMLRFGEKPCDGIVREKVCGACYLESRGLPKWLSLAASQVPSVVAAWSCRRPGRMMTALAGRALAAAKGDELRGLIANSDRIVAVCQWLHDALLRNGVPKEKLVLSRQALSADLAYRVGGLPTSPNKAGGGLRILFLGRLDPAKGLETLVKAVQRLPVDARVTLTIHAIPPRPDHEAYRDRVTHLAQNDERITFAGPVSHDKLPQVFSQHDVLAVPSLVMETGPLVVLEAQAAGLHVLGSRLGGIAELVTDGDTGALVEAGNGEAWAGAIRALALAKQQGSLRRVPKTVRMMGSVASEMIEVYRSL